MSRSEHTILPEINYVYNVRQGWRPPFPEFPSLEHRKFATLIEQCWNQEPSARPNAFNALGRLDKILPTQALAKQDVKDGKDRIKLLVRGEEFIARRSTLACIRRSRLWELVGGGRENDPPKNAAGFIELDEDPEDFETVLGVLQSLAGSSKDVWASGALQRLVGPQVLK